MLRLGHMRFGNTVQGHGGKAIATCDFKRFRKFFSLQSGDKECGYEVEAVFMLLDMHLLRVMLIPDLHYPH
jgi:hypothetical protein